jgi:hypothetical protein
MNRKSSEDVVAAMNTTTARSVAPARKREVGERRRWDIGFGRLDARGGTA